MNKNEYLLTCLAEECAEVAQRVSKALRFGVTEVQQGQPLNNAERIMGEINDLIAVVEILQTEKVIVTGPDRAAINAKKSKLGDWLKQKFPGWRAYFFTGDPQLAKGVRLSASKRTPLFNGKIECRLCDYKIIAGSNRKPVSGE